MHFVNNYIRMRLSERSACAEQSRSERSSLIPRPSVTRGLCRCFCGLCAFSFLLFTFSFGSPAGAMELSDVNWTPNVSLRGTYDDNITSAETDEKSDYITELALGLTAVYEQKTASFKAEATLGHQFFSDYSGYDNTWEKFKVEYKKDISKFKRVVVSDTFSHTYEPQDFAEELGRTAGRYSYYRNRFSLRGEKDMSKQRTVSLEYSFDTDNSGASGSADSLMHRLRAENLYMVDSSLILLAGYEFSWRDFDPGPSARSHTLSGGARKYFTPQLYTDIGAGIQYSRNYNNNDEFSPYLSLLVTDELDATTRLRLSGTKQYYTNSYTADLFDYWQVQAQIDKQIYERLSANCSLYYGEGEYIDMGITDKVTGFSAGLSYELKKNVTLNLDYRYSQTDSTVQGREYERNRIALGVQMRF